MNTRRRFLTASAASAAAIAFANRNTRAAAQSPTDGQTLPAGKPSGLPQNGSSKRFRPKQKLGMGGVQAGNGFFISSDEQAYNALEASWHAGVRYFDTSPYYGVGISERRFGNFLDAKPADEYVISTKVGRVLKPKADADVVGIWKGRLNFEYDYDYTAAGTRRSVEDSLQRLGVPKIDIVFIHDLSPDNPEIGDEWEKHFETARKGAMPELIKMREEGLIKGWGMGVNELAPSIRCVKESDPDIILQATQYSLVKHADALNQLFPVCEDNDVSVVVGAPFMAGYLAGGHRYLYGGKFPQQAREKLAGLQRVAAHHAVDLRTAALRFTMEPDVVSASIPGPRNAAQAYENAESAKASIPADFWRDLKSEGLIEKNAPTPA